MTYSKIVDLQKYLKANVGCNVRIGDIDLGDTELPCILLIPDENGVKDVVQQTQMMSYTFGLKIRIIDTREEITLVKTLKIFDDFLRVINQFEDQAGHVLDEDYVTEYTENNYQITFVYRLRLRIHKTV
jgi:hypothetical protein